MSKFNTNIVHRGDVLMNTANGRIYDLVRESRPVHTFGGGKLYSYNLRNVENGKMRRTDNPVPFGKEPLTVQALEQAFGMSLVVVTDARTIGAKVRKAAAEAVLPTVKVRKAMGQIIRDLSPATPCWQVISCR